MMQHVRPAGIVLGAVVLGAIIALGPIIALGEPMAIPLSLRQGLVGSFSAILGATVTVALIVFGFLQVSDDDDPDDGSRKRRPERAAVFFL